MKLLSCIVLITFSFKLVHAQLPKMYRCGEINGFEAENEFLMNVESDNQGMIWIVTEKSITRYDGNVFHKIHNGGHNQWPFMAFKESSGIKYVRDKIGQVFLIENDSLKPHRYNKIIKERKVFNYHDYDSYFDSLGQLHLSIERFGYTTINDEGLHYLLDKKKQDTSSLVCIIRRDNIPFISNIVRNDSSGMYQKSFISVRHFTLLDSALRVIDKIAVKNVKYRYKASITLLDNGNYLLSDGKGNLIEFNHDSIISAKHYGFIIKVVAQKNNGLWISTHLNGIHYFKNQDYKTEKPIVFFEGTTSVFSTFDIDGGGWIYSEEKGLFHLPKPGFEYFNTDGFSDLKYSKWISTSDEKIYTVGKKNKVFEIDKKTHEVSYTETPHLADDTITQGGHLEYVYHDSINKRTWTSRRGGLFYMERGNWHKHSFIDEWMKIEKPEEDTLTEIVDIKRNPIKFHKAEMDNQSDLIIGSFGHFCNYYFTIKDTNVQYVSSSFKREINQVIMVNDTVYIACGDGLYREVDTKREFLGLSHPELKERINSMTYFDKKIWLSSDKYGLLTLKDDSLNPIMIDSSIVGPSNLIKTSKKELWAFSDQGSFFFQVKSRGKVHVNSYDKLSIRNTLNSSICKSGIYWSTEGEGIIYTPFRAIKAKKIRALDPIIENIYINEKELKTDSFIKNNTLSYNQNYIKINFYTVNFHRNNVTFQYRLKGLNNKWIKSTDQQAIFPSLLPGDYQFEIQAKREGMEWSKLKHIDFSIAPPFWKTWWFIAIVSLVILFITYKVIEYRIKVSIREKNLLVNSLRTRQEALQARMGPHFLFNVIASLQYLILKKKTNKAAKFLDMLSTSMRNIFDQANRDAVTLEKEIQFLKEYMEMEQFRLEDKFDFEINYKPVEKSLQQEIPSFIIQPFIENAIHHGIKNRKSKGTISIKLEKQNDFFIVTILDDGVGRRKAGSFKKKVDLERKSRSIQIVKERLQLLNKKKENIEIKDLYDDKGKPLGTKIKLLIRQVIKRNESINY